MLRNELVIGFTVAGFAAALVPPEWLSGVLHAVRSVPFIGYPLLLAVGLGLAIVTFVCSMGNVPIARFLANEIMRRFTPERLKEIESFDPTKLEEEERAAPQGVDDFSRGVSEIEIESEQRRDVSA